jgi:hypothetical protein
MRAGIQTFLDEAGDAACYAIDIVKIAERFLCREIDVVTALEAGINYGFVHYNWNNPADNDNFFVKQPAELLGFLTSRKWTVRKEMPDYVPQPGELVVQRWERKRTGSTIGHFRLPDWDSLVASQTVRYGELVSLRIFALA